MESIARPTICALNDYVSDQRHGDGEARITLIQFDSTDPFDVVLDGVDITRVKGLDPERYRPRAMTPLYDAIGRLIARIDGAIADRADRGLPIEDQLVVIVTDGLENASTDFTQQAIRDAIQLRQKRTWTFKYMGANQAAVFEADKIGINDRDAAGWDATVAGSGLVWQQLSTVTTDYRTREIMTTQGAPETSHRY